MAHLPPILLIHGAGGGSWEWSVWLPELKLFNSNTYAVELQSHKKGLRHTELDHYLDQVINFCRENHLEKPVIIGSHMGAVLAIKCQAYVPASALILIDPLIPSGFLNRKGDAHFPEIVSFPTRSREGETSVPARMESGRVYQQLHQLSQFPKPTGPCLIVLAENDEDTPAEAGNELAEWLGADVASYAGMDHIDLLMGMKARDIARDTLNWLKKIL